MSALGDFKLGDTIDFYFTTRRFSTGAPFTLAGTPAVSVYEDDSTTEITAGITLDVDFDSRTGLNHVRVVLTGGNGFESGKSYAAVITAGTVDGVSVVGETLEHWSIERGAAYQRLGAPAGASISADIASVSTSVASVATAVTAVDDYVDTEVAAIKAQTDQLAFTGGRVNANLASTEHTSIADALLKRDWTLVTGEAARSVLNALRFLRNKWVVDLITATTGTLSVKKEDDSTEAWNGTVTAADKNPVTSIDPA